MLHTKPLQLSILSLYKAEDIILPHYCFPQQPCLTPEGGTDARGWFFLLKMIVYVTEKNE